MLKQLLISKRWPNSAANDSITAQQILFSYKYSK